MKNGFFKVAAASFPLIVANVAENAAAIKTQMDIAEQRGVGLIVFPELSLTGASALDLFLSSALLNGARDALLSLAAYTRGKNIIAVVGAPLAEGGKVYNVAAVLGGGEILGIIPKCAVKNRVFASGMQAPDCVLLGGECIPFGTDLVFAHETLPTLRFGVEIGDDCRMPVSPSVLLTAAGAAVIARPSAYDAAFGNADEEESMLKAMSARLFCSVISADAPYTESTQDIVYSSHHVIAECGTLLASAAPFADEPMLITDVDTELCYHERAKTSFFDAEDDARIIPFKAEVHKTSLDRTVAQNPFMPEDPIEREKACAHILDLQAHALARRMAHTRAKVALLGISGGLDSTLALLVMARAYDILQWPRADILAITMPGFGTSKRTYNNAVGMCNALGVRLREVSIAASVTQHFADIGQDPAKHDVTYENAQARERTQILMDVANMEGGLVVGTGDISEMALGWATYNGDHMSMYAVNASVTKTQVRALVDYEARHADEALATVLFDILGTPVSPELLPPDKKGNIAQKTEDIVGPYALHDFFLYYTVRYGFSPEKIYRMARRAFGEAYDGETVKKWLAVFARRFFAQQFKRSCMPDGPKTGAISLSPRGAWQMPSDASGALWLAEIERIED